MFKNIREDINSVFERDPAARNVMEIIFCIVLYSFYID